MKTNLLLLAVAVIIGCSREEKPVTEETSQVEEITILFTNDFESAFDPIPAYWRDDVEFLGGAAQLKTMVDSIRKAEDMVLLFDAGDMFTGTLSNRTQGELLMEMMITLGYDAMAIGNHEFDYGWRNFRHQMFRVPFPVLGANIFYKDTSIPFSQPYAILEREGIRIGVIGVIGQHARSVVIASNVDSLDFIDPAIAVNAAMEELQDDVDIIVLLTHQGKTGPMQTDQEAHPEIWRDFDEDIALSGSIQGIDVHLAGHAHRGIHEPFVHPETGTLIMQTFGHATHLGFIKLHYDRQQNQVVGHEGALLDVVSNHYTPDPIMLSKIEAYREKYPELQEVVGKSEARLVRKYNQESDLGNLFTDILRAETQSDVSFFNSGGIRADLPEGEINKADMLDAFPFQDKIWILNMTGAQIKEVLEQAFTLERGIIQVSGLKAEYNPRNPPGQRLTNLSINGQPVKDQQIYTASTIGVIAEGGDLYTTFTESEIVENDGPYFAEVLEAYLRGHEIINIPDRGRLIPSE
jgi:2',3'-cyclic-nucleotide 2'-phosphodiesterase (5'-nucleotidase family)